MANIWQHKLTINFALLTSGIAHLLFFGSLYVIFQLASPAPRVGVDFQWVGNTSSTGSATSPAAQPRPSRPVKTHQFNFSQEVGTAETSVDTGESTPGTPSGAPGVGGGVVSTARVTRLPRRIREVRAQYPGEARRLGIEGKVIMALTIDEQGNVKDVKLLEGAGHGFDEEAIKATKQFTFTPAYLGDKPVTVEIRYTYVFELR